MRFTRSIPEARRAIPREQVVRMVIGIVLVLVMLYGYRAYGTLTASSRLSPAAAASEGYVDVVVTIPTDAEQFHLKELRGYGVMAGRVDQDDSKVRLVRVSQDDLHGLARIPWVVDVDLLDR